ncbi:hypothetical protein FEM48_Zijuj06G0177700 [Ziziphus jujuba var. spinosa]|uniref:Disease resistance protein At4g27190-like leucine-rich repeats domain-containing protein n=1 Tax=Ziziphus jujuba var. spinosa TaxID=714518 RepID=A0A978VAQ4_ZIZJJ|nr:hypothetical protein FEM48_Zijuj06G0177700 [Ziziphus jujuba var. spinosa]
MNPQVEFSNLESLRLLNLNIRKVWSGQLQCYQKTLVDQGAFGNLSKIIVSGCDNLKALIPLSLATTLEHLQTLEVDKCKVMEEIVYSTEESEEEIRLENILFPKLRFLSLSWIPNLVTIIKDSKSTRTDNEAEGQYSVAYNQPLFNSKVEFSNLESLRLLNLNIGKVWSGQLQCYQKTLVDQGAFGNLSKIFVSGCDNLRALIPSSLATTLEHLRTLEIDKCKVMEEIICSTEESEEEIRLENILFPKLQFLSLSWIPNLGTIIKDSKSTRIDNEAEGIDSVAYNRPLFNSKVEFSNMKELYLQSLNSLKMIWDMRLLEKFDNNLTRVIVKKCDNLKSLIPSSLCESLVHLEWLQIGGCENIREIASIEESEGQEKLGKILFPQLRSLMLYDLPKLKRFYAGDCIECPSLKELEINNCGKMETFISNSLPSHIDNENEEIESVKFPNLEVLKIHKIEVISEIWDGNQYSTLPFPQLKSIELDSIFSESYIFSFKFVQRLEHLQHVCIRGPFMESLISSDEAHHILMPSRKLDLDALPKLMRLCDEGVQTCKTFRVVEVLNVSSLEKFYSGNNIIRLPNLEKLIVNKCTEMRTFSHGTVYTPRLYRITIKQRSALFINDDWEYQELLEGDVNTTLQKLWEDHKLLLPHHNTTLHGIGDSVNLSNEYSIIAKGALAVHFVLY